MTDIPGGEGGFELGRAFVSVVPDASDFVQALDEEIGGLQTTVRVTPDTSDFAAAVDEQLGGLAAVVKVTADTTEAVTQVDSFLEDVSNTSPVITLGVDTDEALGQVDAFVADAEAEIASIGDEPVIVSIIPDMGDFDDALAEGLGGGGTVSVAADGEEAVEGLAGAMDGLTGSTEGATEALGEFDGAMAGSGGAISTLGAEVDELGGKIDALAAGFGASVAGHLGEISGVASALEGTLQDALSGQIGDDLEISVPVVPEMSNFADAVAEGAGGVEVQVDTVPDMSNFESAVKEETGLEVRVDAVPNMEEFEALAQAQANSMSVTLKTVPEMDESDLGGSASTGQNLKIIAGDYDDITESAQNAAQAAGGVAEQVRATGEASETLTATVTDMGDIGAATGAAAEGLTAIESGIDAVGAGLGRFATPFIELQNEASQLGGALSDLNERFSALTESGELTAEQATAWGEALSGLDQNFDALRSNVVQLDQWFQSGSVSASQMSAGLKDIGANVDELAPAIGAFSGQLDQLVASGQEVDTSLTEVASAVGVLHDDMGTLAAPVAQADDSLTAVASAVGVMEGALSSATAGTTPFTDGLAGIQAAAESTDAGISEVAQTALGLGESIPVLNSSITELDAKFLSLAADTSGYSGDASEYSEAIARMGDGMLTLHGQASELGSSLQSVDSMFASGSASVEELEAALSNAGTQYATLKTNVTSVASSIEASGSSFLDAQEMADRLGVTLDELPAKAQALYTTIAGNADDAEASLAKLQASFAGLAEGEEEAGEGLTAFEELTSGSMVAKMAEMFADPLTGLLAFTAAIGVGGVEIADYENKQNDLLATMQKQDQATGTNITGYQQLSTQLTGAAGAAVATSIANQNATTSYESMHDGINNLATAIPAVTAAQQAAQTAATNLSTNLGTLEQTYGLTQQQAEQLATAAGVSAKQLDSSGTSANDAMSKIEAYANANESAMGPVGELSNDMSTFSNNALTASTRVNALDDAYNLLVGNFVTAQQATLSVSQDFLTISSNAQQAGASMSGTNSASVTLQQSFYSTIPAIEQAANAMVKQGDSTQQVNTYIDQQVTKLQGLTGGNQQAQTAVQGLKQWEDQLKGSTDNLDTSITKAAQDIENQYVAQITSAGVNSSTAKTDVENLTTAIQNNGTQSTQYQGARAQLIKDLENAGVQASTAQGLVAKLTGSIEQIPSTKDVTIQVNGQGQWTVHEEAGVEVPTAMSGTTAHLATTGAGGGVIPGFSPGNDVVPAMLSPGEGVLVPEAVQALGEDTVHQLNAMYSGGGRPSTGALKKFAAGGIAGSSSLSSMPAYISSNYNSTVTQGENLVLGAILNAEGFAKGGVVQIPHYATGGVVWDAAAAGSAYGHNTANMTAMDTMAMQGQMINGSSMPYATGAAARNINVSFNGITSFPNPEQIQAIQLALSAAVGVS